jgi:hypothetical protein
MFGFRGRLLCAALTLGARLQATPTLTTIEDTLFTADGNRFNGVVTISWQSFEAADTSNVAGETLRLRISNGLLYVQMVPTTNANSPAIYNVQYTSQDGIQFSEAWAVPPGILPIRVRDVRVTPGSVTGSAPGTSTAIQITDVTGLQNALNIRLTSGTAFSVSRAAVINSTGSIDAAVGNLSDCLHVDGSSGACGSGGSGASGTFVDGEIPLGALDGSNTTFTLANAPIPASGLVLFRNGLLLRQGTDYTLSTRSVTFLTGATPQPGDLLLASYRISVNLPGVGFVDAEVPSGAINGSNAIFTLSQIPTPAAGVSVYRNGLRLASSIDYNISGNTITFTSSLIPQSGDLLFCSYRIAQ